MAIFNEDFIEFLELLNINKVKYMLVGGYAVILHGYVRSTSDMDIWVEKSEENYLKIKKTYQDFGAPFFSKQDFFDEKFDVWAIGREPNKIEIITKIDGISFEESISFCEYYQIKNTKIPYIHLNFLIKNKLASGRYKDLADIEQLSKLIKKAGL